MSLVASGVTQASIMLNIMFMKWKSKTMQEFLLQKVG